MPVEPPVQANIANLDLRALVSGRAFHHSPTAWEDEVLYFLMVDRFSNGKEAGFIGIAGAPVPAGAGQTTPAFSDGDAGNAITTEMDAATWRDAGGRWCGGTLKGLETKLGYLKRLGITAIWISPIFKQVSFQPTYHGYGIQNYLDVDPHFGSRTHLRELVDEAHRLGIRVILDIILNHSGNVFSYDLEKAGTDDPRWTGSEYPVKGFNTSAGQPVVPFESLPVVVPDPPTNDAIWPREFQTAKAFTRRGRIEHWDDSPEFLEGDFYDLKDVHLGEGGIDVYQPSAALKALCGAYKFWIAYADLDGFRVDTVKHMDPGAARYFTSVIHEFAQTLGKDKFYLIGEITGGRDNAYTTLETTGLNAALGVDDIPGRLEGMVKGSSDPADYFNLFRNSVLVGKESHTWFRDKVVTLIDDHDQVRNPWRKARFAASGPPATLALAALSLNTTTLGIPCIYYGSEQMFDGAGEGQGADRYLRECMFGGDFGAFRSRGRHFFREDGWLFGEIGKVLAVRHAQLALRRGRQYLREISGNGADYGLPRMIGGQMRSIVAWSRIIDTTEILAAINTDIVSSVEAFVTVDAEHQDAGGHLTCLYSTDPAQIGGTIGVGVATDGRHFVTLRLPPAGFALYR